jgi:hypothetical protein
MGREMGKTGVQMIASMSLGTGVLSKITVPRSSGDLLDE